MSRSLPPDIEIARNAQLRPIDQVATALGLKNDEFEAYGDHKAKVSLEVAGRPPRGELVLVTGINPTPAGEGKSTVAVGLSQALCRAGLNAVLCLREPSLGPIFGIKGGAAGGGRAQVVPMEDINLHFTGDMHAITAAHSLLAAALDNHLYQGNELGIDPERISWPRAVDMNDRALREIQVGLAGKRSVPRADRFVITAASEVMAVFCLADGLGDLVRRLGDMVVGFTQEGDPVVAQDLRVAGAMAVLLRDALAPNLVQTLEGGPAFVHGGPFGNIAHGCNSLVATRAALALGDVVVTEAGFGADLGAEKFFNIKSRAGGLRPKVAVVVATARALRLHGGATEENEWKRADPEAVGRGLPNLEKHIEIVQRHGVRPIVAVNRFDGDTDAEYSVIEARCRELDVPCVSAEVWARGGEGGEALARAVQDALRDVPDDFEPLYGLETSLEEKIGTIAREVYGARAVEWTGEAETRREELERLGYGDLPICMAKTQYSLSDDASRRGRPEGFEITVRDLRVSAGAGFVVAYTGNVLTMPGLPGRPAAEEMRLREDGEIEGLF